MSEQLEVAVCQMSSIDDAQQNLDQMCDMAHQALEQKSETQVLFFPENCLYQRIDESEKLTPFKLQDEVFSQLAVKAKTLKIDFHLGGVPLYIDGKIFNSTLLVTREGVIKVGYQKIHLFDIQLENGTSVKESAVFESGRLPRLLNLEGWTFGESICYDIRFAEIYSVYARKSIDGLIIPAAFLKETGRAHWDILLRARAIESQCYVIAAAQSGRHLSKKVQKSRESWGHSAVIGPWGEIVVQSSSQSEDILFASLSKYEIHKVRKQIPMGSHRRWPVYTL